MKEYTDGISVIVPVYNAERYLKKCIKSILNQTYKDIEIICVDSASEDNSLKILKNLKKEDDRIIIIEEQENKGAGYNRNVGLKHVTKKYIGFVDADDFIDVDYYERLLDASNMFDADIAVSDVFEFMPEGNRVINDHKYNLHFEYNLTKMFKLMKTGSVWDKLYRTDLILNNDIKFIEGVIHEDIAFVLETFHKANKIVTVPGSYYYWQRNSTSVTLGMVYNHCRASDAYTVARYMFDYLKKNRDISKSDIEYIVIWIITHFGLHAMRDVGYREKLIQAAKHLVPDIIKYIPPDLLT